MRSRMSGRDLRRGPAGRALCSVYWYCARDWRPEFRLMFCTGCRTSVMPGTLAVARAQARDDRVDVVALVRRLQRDEHEALVHAALADARR